MMIPILFVALLMQTLPIPVTTIAKGEHSAIDELRARWSSGRRPTGRSCGSSTTGTIPARGRLRHARHRRPVPRDVRRYSVEITGEQGRRLAVVRYVEKKPAARDVTAQVLTMPFHLVSVPRIRAGAVREGGCRS
jgi:hypothetical protein